MDNNEKGVVIENSVEERLTQKFAAFKKIRVQINATKLSNEKKNLKNEKVKTQMKSKPNEQVSTTIKVEELAKMLTGEEGIVKIDKKETFKRIKLVGNKRTFETCSRDTERDEIESSPVQSPNIINSANNYFDNTGDSSLPKTLYIRGANLIDTEIREVAEKYGNVEKIYIPSNQSCAFVNFDTNQSLEAAMKAMDKTIIGGCTIHTNYARQQQPRGSNYAKS